MRRKATRSIAGAVLVLTLGAGLVGAVAPDAGAIGAEAYKTDRSGRKTSQIWRWGNTGSTANCAGAALGAVGYGFQVCYTPIP